MTSTIFVPQFKAMSSYQSIQELIASVEKRISELKAGNQHIDELEALVSDARELYERLLVLRHKAYEEVASADVEQEELTEEPEAETKPEEINFTPNINPNQTSLIDAIVEIEEETGIPEVVVEEQAKVLEDAAIEEVAEVEEVNEIEESQEQEEEQDDSEKSLVEQYAEENDSQSLAEKHVMSPIADLTNAIALNQKFLFINELFGGDSDAYNQAISTLNNGGDSSGAMSKVEELKSQFSWENEEVAETFVTLVKRRHA